jgi:hypothetical protein
MHRTTAGDSTYTYEDESGLRRQIMPYARNIPTLTPIKGVINFVNLNELIGNDETAGNPA